MCRPSHILLCLGFGLMVGCEPERPSTSTTRPTSRPTSRPTVPSDALIGLSDVPSSVPDTLTEAAAHRTAVTRMQAVWKALMDFHDDKAHEHFPAGVALTKDSVGLSWRVQLLPYLGEKKLYEEFKLTEGWDSEHNKKLLDKMPDVFASAGKPADKGNTFLRTTRGPNGVIAAQFFPPGGLRPSVVEGGEPGQPVRGRSVGSFSDGFHQTILFAESQTAVPWTKPEEMELVPAPQAQQSSPGIVKTVPPKLGGAFDGGFHAVFGNGTVVFYKPSLPADDLGCLMTVSGGEVVRPLPVDHTLYAVPPKK